MAGGWLWHRLFGDRRGVTAIEYALIAALVFLVIIGGVSSLGSAVQNMLYSKIAGAM